MAREKEPKITQPTDEMQRIYSSLIENEPTVVTVMGTRTRYKIRWLKNGQLRKLSMLLLGNGKENAESEKTTSSEILDSFLNDNELACKAAAIYILDGYWKIKFLYSFLWRWFYYVKQYDNIQLQPILDEGKKKIPQIQFFYTITSLTGAKDTLMQMRQREVESILREHVMDQREEMEKQDNGL